MKDVFIIALGAYKDYMKVSQAEHACVLRESGGKTKIPRKNHTQFSRLMLYKCMFTKVLQCTILFQ